jgi:hypothetical protein
MLRECRASGADTQTMLNAAAHAKYAVLMCGRPPEERVDIAHSEDAFSSRLAMDLRRAAAMRSRRRRTRSDYRRGSHTEHPPDRPGPGTTGAEPPPPVDRFIFLWTSSLGHAFALTRR